MADIKSDGHAGSPAYENIRASAHIEGCSGDSEVTPDTMESSVVSHNYLTFERSENSPSLAKEGAGGGWFK